LTMKKTSKIFFPLFLALLLIITGYFFITRYISRLPSKSSEYACRLEIKQRSYTSFEGEKIIIPIEVENQGRATWISRGKYPCLLSYHLFGEKGKIIRFDNRRYPLPGDVKPGQSIKMRISLISPLEKGNYSLEFDLLKEGLFWFKSQGSPTSSINLQVKARTWPEDNFDLNLDYGRYTKFKSSLPELNKIAKLIRLTLSHNEQEFKGKTGKVRGFAAGTNYPQIWLRDASTIIPAARYFYEAGFLYSWLEEHLFFQKDNGSLNDWLDSQGRKDKNTTETDQEASAIQAAYQIFELLGPAWFEKQIRQKRIIQRLTNALEYVFSARFNKKLGLVKGAHTPDWGDIDMIDQDQQAIYVDDKTHWTADIYDQSMVYQACLNLSQMLEAAGDEKKASFWKKRADNIRDNCNKWLWQDDKGFYKIHLHLDFLQHKFDENNILAVGGNTLAIISGLADSSRAVKIIREIIKRQKRYQVSTISATLLPPYPKNFFKHPLVDDPYEYQNGGQWDWFGGRFIYAMFETGFSLLAKKKLMEILHKDLNNKSFYEWHSRHGRGHGSDFFGGSAGSLSQAIYEGYFGIRWQRDGLNLEPKLAQDSAQIHVYLPANDIFVAYDYRFDKKMNRISMRYKSNFPHQGRIKILAPWVQQSSLKKTADLNLTVKIDGRKTDYYCQQHNNDRLIIISTDFKNHLLEIIKKD